MKRVLANKGFTLVEIIGIIILLGVVAMIVVPSVQKYNEEAKEKTYEVNKTKIIEAAKNYYNKYGATLVSENYDDGYQAIEKITIEELKNSEFLTSDSIINPYTGEEMTNCISITSYMVSSNPETYNYTYELGCD